MLRRAVPIILLPLLVLTGCSNGEEKESTQGSGQVVEEAAISEAEAVLTAFFAVKAHKEDPYGTKVKAQYPFLTSPEVHPGKSYVDTMGENALGIEEESTDLTFSEAKFSKGEVRVKFKSLTHAVSYALVEGKMTDQGAKTWSRWDGTATLVQKDGKWLISRLTMDRIGGGTGEGPEDDASPSETSAPE